VDQKRHGGPACAARAATLDSGLASGVGVLYWSLFGCGLLLSMHCVGMCGGFVALLSAQTAPNAGAAAAALGGGRPIDGRGPQRGYAARPADAPGWTGGPVRPGPAGAPLLRAHLLYHLGRIASYAALGALAGELGSLPAVMIRTGRPQAWLMLAAGGMMAAAGLAILGLTRWNPMRPPALAPGAGWMGRAARLPMQWFRAGLRRVLRWPRAVVAAPYGALMGLLPCGLIYTMLIRAAASASALGGAAVMASFGAGTIPALLLVAYGTRIFTLQLRRRLFAVSGVFLLALGAAAMWHGLQWAHGGGMMMMARAGL
jgi:sulfite exporter TauE/SafE